MKKAALVFLCVLVFILPLGSCSQKEELYRADSPDGLKSTAVCLVNLETNQVIYEKNSGKYCLTGALAQLMAALVVTDECLNPAQTMAESNQFTFNGIAGRALPNVNIENKERYTVDELLNAMVLGSAYDAANVLAQSFGDSSGDPKAFVAKMNKKAGDLGMTNTQYTTASGLCNETIRSNTTAYDTYLLARYIYENRQVLFDMSNKVNYTIAAREQQFSYKVTNKNALIDAASGEYKYDYAKGIKFISDSVAGDCLVTFAQKEEGGPSYILVLLSAPYSSSEIPPQNIYDPNAEKETPASGEDAESSSEAISQEDEGAPAAFAASSAPVSSSLPLSPAPTDSAPSVFAEAKTLFDWAFDTISIEKYPEDSGIVKAIPFSGSASKKEIRAGLDVSAKSLVPGGTDTNSVKLLCQSKSSLSQEVKKGDIVGSAKIIIPGDEKAPTTVNLVALENSSESKFFAALKQALLVGLALLILAFCVMVVIRFFNLQKARKRREARRRRSRAAADKSRLK
ncbi:MAG: hypothetical protein LBC56_05855 [Oscillospiraceae bacterium]|jgi:D-alanyl-D-alanine carboxypeptidase|nr:hypothetical protein [Oscillospiraceae bacterium]